MTATLHLMRHGHVRNPTQILYGRMPGFGLSQLGESQARSARDWLADEPLRAIYSSPMQRAQETAAVVAEAHPQLKTAVDERLIEVLTPYEGEPTADLAAKGWDLYTGNEPPYEVPATVLERVLDFFDFVAREHDGQSVAAIGHGDILVFPWLFAQGVMPAAPMKDMLLEYALPVEYPQTASIMTFELRGSPRRRLPGVSYHCPY